MRYPAVPDERYKQAYTLRKYDKLKYREIAVIMNVSVERARQLAKKGERRNWQKLAKFYTTPRKLHGLTIIDIEDGVKQDEISYVTILSKPRSNR